MAQFDVYRNPSQKTKKLFPYFLDIQNPVISDISTRIVLPLGKLEYFNNEAMEVLTPIIEYKGDALILLTPQIASIPASLLKNPIGSLSHRRDEIVSALDFAITGI